MQGMSYWAVVVAAVAAFVVGALWYSPLLFGEAYMKVRDIDPVAMADVRPPVPEMLGEFVKNLCALPLCRASWGRRLERCRAAWTLGLGWVSGHASDGRRPS